MRDGHRVSRVLMRLDYFARYVTHGKLRELYRSLFVSRIESRTVFLAFRLA